MEHQKVSLIVDLVKWVLGTLTIGAATTYIGFIHKQKELDIAQLDKERAFLETFSKDAMSEDIAIRIRLAHYIHFATTDPKLKAQWKEYHKELVDQCKKYYSHFHDVEDEEGLKKLDKVLCEIGGVDKVVRRDEVLVNSVNAGMAPENGYWPLALKKSTSFLTGSRRFGGRRAGTRLHAGSDMLAPPGTPVIASENGVILRDPYHFYLGTYAVELKTDRGLVIRYGNLEKGVPKGLQRDKRVKAGDIIGYVGEQESGASFLHFELYAGTASGTLTQGGNDFKRRADILDPTEYLSGLLDNGQVKNAAPHQVSESEASPSATVE